uniref:Uncharacterized protein n=1 Tax=Anopheles melas TaxID=34690 RepID=A0A182TR50_9DIPT
MWKRMKMRRMPWKISVSARKAAAEIAPPIARYVVHREHLEFDRLLVLAVAAAAARLILEQQRFLILLLAVPQDLVLRRDPDNVRRRIAGKHALQHRVRLEQMHSALGRLEQLRLEAADVLQHAHNVARIAVAALQLGQAQQIVNLLRVVLRLQLVEPAQYPVHVAVAAVIVVQEVGVLQLVQGAYLLRDVHDVVAADVQVAKPAQLANLLRQAGQSVVGQEQRFQLRHVPEHARLDLLQSGVVAYREVGRVQVQPYQRVLAGEDRVRQRAHQVVAQIERPERPERGKHGRRQDVDLVLVHVQVPQLVQRVERVPVDEHQLVAGQVERLEPAQPVQRVLGDLLDDVAVQAQHAQLLVEQEEVVQERDEHVAGQIQHLERPQLLEHLERHHVQPVVRQVQLGQVAEPGEAVARKIVDRIVGEVQHPQPAERPEQVQGQLAEPIAVQVELDQVAELPPVPGEREGELLIGHVAVPPAHHLEIVLVLQGELIAGRALHCHALQQDALVGVDGPQVLLVDRPQARVGAAQHLEKAIYIFGVIIVGWIVGLGRRVVRRRHQRRQVDPVAPGVGLDVQIGVGVRCGR